MTKRIVGGRAVADRRTVYQMETVQAIAEPFLKKLYPGIYKRAEDDFDQMPRLFYDGAWRDHRDDIVGDIQAFADFHPVDEQRDEASIKHWAMQAAPHLEGEYSQSYYRIAVHVGLLGYVEHMRELRHRMHCEPGWHRILERFFDACHGQPGFGFLNAPEKWGVLSINYRCDPSGEAVCRAAETEAFEKSSKTCEKCGLPGELRRLHWRKTLCDRHFLDALQTLSEDERERLHLLYLADREHVDRLAEEYDPHWHTTAEMIENFQTLLHDRGPNDLRLYCSIQCVRRVLERRIDGEDP